jgi:hypothetical protein
VNIIQRNLNVCLEKKAFNAILGKCFFRTVLLFSGKGGIEPSEKMIQCFFNGSGNKQQQR